MVLWTDNSSDDNRPHVFILHCCLPIWGKTDWINYLFPWNGFHIRHASVFKETYQSQQILTMLPCLLHSAHLILRHFVFILTCWLSMDNFLLNLSIDRSLSIEALFINWCLSVDAFLINWCLSVDAFFIDWCLSVDAFFINWCLSVDAFFINWCLSVDAFLITWWSWQFLCILVY